MSHPNYILPVVHCIDTEGPLFEPLTATFERIHMVFGLQLPASEETLAKLRKEEIPLNGLEGGIRKMIAANLLAYNSTWDQIDTMLDTVMSAKYRRDYQDSFGNGWVFNWFCLDHTDYSYNPRRRDMGYHNVFDHYQLKTAAARSALDSIQFHYHPRAFSGAAHHSGTHYFAHNDSLFQILARRIIDRMWFPSAYRPGFHTIRPDSHWFLEQYIPFDFSSQAGDDHADDQPDNIFGRYGDWREAPRSWVPYHPDHDNYQQPGSCRRWTGRCLNVGTRLRCLTAADVDQAFAESRAGKPAVLAFTNHDFRNIDPDIRAVHAQLTAAAQRFPEVAFQFCDARQAMRLALQLPPQPPVQFKLEWIGNRLDIEADRPIFGPQPFLALKTTAGDYYHDNLDFLQPFRHWSYVFDEHTLPMSAVANVGIAANDSTGNVTVSAVDMLADRTVATRIY